MFADPLNDLDSGGELDIEKILTSLFQVRVTVMIVMNLSVNLSGTGNKMHKLLFVEEEHPEEATEEEDVEDRETVGKVVVAEEKVHRAAEKRDSRERAAAEGVDRVHVAEEEVDRAAEVVTRAREANRKGLYLVLQTHLHFNSEQECIFLLKAQTLTNTFLPSVATHFIVNLQPPTDKL